MTAPSANVARYLPELAASTPGFDAIRIVGDDGVAVVTLSSVALNSEADAWAWRLQRAGVRRGDRVLLLVRPGLPLIAAVFALFKTGAVPVVVDPGMGRASFLECVRRTEPGFLLGIARAHAVSWVFAGAFRSVRKRILVRGGTTARIASGNVAPFPIAPTGARDLAAILFTSGSTGAPKGVRADHGMLEAQVRLVRDTFGVEPGEVDMPLLPIFALFNPALGMTTVVPRVDPTRPATLDPAHVARTVIANRVTNSFGAPVLWGMVAEHCNANGVSLPSLRRVLMAGAPVSPEVFAAMRRACPNAALHSPYGATEVLPVATIESAEVLGSGDTPGTAVATLAGRGTCVGKPVHGVEVRVIEINDGPIADIAATRNCSVDEIGEIIVRGPVASRSYDNLPDANAASKIPDGDEVWHRMGDVGCFDAAGRLWFCGRKAERVVTSGGSLFTECIEPIYNTHHAVHRTALIGFGKQGSQRPALAIEPKPGARPRDSAARRALARELRGLATATPGAPDIRVFYFVEKFPVDVRHNAKIHRLRLAHDLAGTPGIELDKR
ncbi:MAG TPA: fatty acid CoA ligase family protein [Opitutaceae bacterium]|nr:fatty acid CoA ligase family protein [Opitutaceae bacterium]